MKFAISVPIGAWHDQLPTTISSLLLQKADLEIAILDASNDPRVRALVEENANKFKYVRHGPDLGQSDAIIEGWDNTESEWLGWLNADDALLPRALAEVQSHVKAEPSLEVVYGHSIILDDGEHFLGYHFNVEPPGPRLLEAGIVSQPSCFFKRDAYERIGGLNRDLHFVMDWDLWIRLYLDDAKFGFIDRPLSQVVWGTETKTASLGIERRRELKALIETHTPNSAQKHVFRDFLIHTLTDKLWPAALRKRLQKKLRSVGQTVFGLRADGLISERCSLFFPFFEPTPPRTLTLQFNRAVDAENIECEHDFTATVHNARKVSLSFASDFEASDILEVVVTSAVSEALYFERAYWSAQ